MIVRRALSLELETDLDFPTVEPDDTDELFKDLDASRRGRSPSISRLTRPIFPSRFIDLFQNETGLEVVEMREPLPSLSLANSFPDRSFGICSLLAIYIITSSNVISPRIRFRLSLFSYLFVGNWILKGKHDLDAVY